ncbi:hypothetical protein DL93DRAFT_2114156 [Clavulina sp. PMI_390]|nr:hypothetical protein DL93DRAFT_2114156 [Clavulina sp. PMI_390]
MSYDRRPRYNHGGGGRRDRDHEDRNRRLPETEDQKLRNAIIRLGDNPNFQVNLDLNAIADGVKNGLPHYIPQLADALRVSIYEQPYKTPYTAALFQVVAQSYAQGEADQSASPTKLLFQELCKAFQNSLDHLAWRDLRLMIQFFAYLTVSKVVSLASFLELLQSFLVVLDEPGLSWERLEASALCIGDGLIRAGLPLYEYDPSAVETMISTIRSCLTTAKSQSFLTRPIAPLHSKELSGAKELLDTLVVVLDSQLESQFKDSPECLPQPQLLFPIDDSFQPFDIPSTMVPPEDTDTDDLTALRKIMMPRVALRFFDADTTPPPNSLDGYIIRGCMIDTINIFEVNRKECARLLLELPKWFAWGTFKDMKGLGAEPDSLVDLEYMLEMTLLEVLLSELAILPTSSAPSIYYAAVISELCKLSAKSVGPAVGKSIRKFYSWIGEGLDVEIIRRFAEWFAVHMSNFGFNWVWHEWVPDLERPRPHPKRQFMKHALELEIRLAYHERIAKNLPEALVDPDAGCLSEAAPGPEFEYDSPQHPYHEPAETLHNLFRNRTAVDGIIPVATALRTSLPESIELPAHLTASSVVRSITMQILLHVGSRSMSHLLNAIERYLPLMRSLATTSEEKEDYCRAASRFWRRNSQMVGIVFDKLMQYQIVDPGDIIAWSFHRSDADGDTPVKVESSDEAAAESSAASDTAMIDVHAWSLLKAALDKAIGRVAIAQGKVLTLRKDDEDAKAKAMMAVPGAGVEVEEMDLDTEGDGGRKKNKHLAARSAEISESLANAEKALRVLQGEERDALAKALGGFVKALTTDTSSEATAILTKDGWDGRDEWTKVQWEHWETWGWYRHFARSYAAQLRANQRTLEAVPLVGLASAEEGSTKKLVWDIWAVAVGRV